MGLLMSKTHLYFCYSGGMGRISYCELYVHMSLCKLMTSLVFLMGFLALLCCPLWISFSYSFDEGSSWGTHKLA